MVQWLIKKGGDPLLTDTHQRTLLHWAVTTPAQVILYTKHFIGNNVGIINVQCNYTNMYSY